jgi:hypothetical protein
VQPCTPRVRSMSVKDPKKELTQGDSWMMSSFAVIVLHVELSFVITHFIIMSIVREWAWLRAIIQFSLPHVV